jgi:hypothetical protein
MQSNRHTCRNCHHSFSGNYCNNCGEKSFHDKDKSLGHVFAEGFHFLTHFEGKFLTTIKTIVRSPGKFSLDYCNGVRKKYFKPVSLFLLLVVLYLLFPRMQGLNMKLQTYVNTDYNYAWYGAPLVKAKMQSSGYKFRELAEKYNQASPKISKILLLLYLPLTALVLWALFPGRKRAFYDHFIMSAEFNSFMMGLILALFPLLLLVFWLIARMTGIGYTSDEPVGYLLFFLLSLFSFFAFRRFYVQKPWVTLVKTLVFVGLFLFVVHAFYNIILLATVLLFV